MRLLKKISLLLVICLLLSVVPAMASGNINDYYNNSTQGKIVNTETVVIDGVSVIFTRYDNNGVFSETVSIDKDVNLNQISVVNREKLKDNILAIANQRDKDMYQMLVQNDSSLQSDLSPISLDGYYSWTEEKNNGAAGTGLGEAPKTYAGHWSTIDYSFYDTAGGMEAYNGASRVLYGGSYTVSAMQLTETITRASWQISVSYPWGFSITPSKESASLTSYWPGSSFMCTQYRNNFSASTLVNIQKYVGVSTIVLVYLGSDSYPAAVSSTW